MDKTALYGNEKEKKQHLHNIESIAHDTGIPYDDVALLYEVALDKTRKGARVKDYLPILVPRKVKYVLITRLHFRHIG